MVRAITRILVLCLKVAALFAFAASTTFAATTVNSRQATIHPNVSFNIGTLCIGEVLGYKITSTELGGSALIECTDPVTVDFVNKVYYCTNGIPSLDICFNWQLKAYKSHCVINYYTTNTSCPPNYEDTYNCFKIVLLSMNVSI